MLPQNLEDESICWADVSDALPCEDIWGLPNSLQNSPPGNIYVSENAPSKYGNCAYERQARTCGSRIAAVSSALGRSRLGQLRGSSAKGAYRGFGLVTPAMITAAATTQQPWQ